MQNKLNGKQVTKRPNIITAKIQTANEVRSSSGSKLVTADSPDFESLRRAHVNEISNSIRGRGMNNLLANRLKALETPFLDFTNRLLKDHGPIYLEWLRDAPQYKAKWIQMLSRMSNTNDKGTTFGDGAARVGMQLRSSPEGGSHLFSFGFLRSTLLSGGPENV
ncbi:hypothetical protein Tco_1000533 [Tanacetum coccineum]